MLSLWRFRSRRFNEEYRVLLHTFGVVQLYSTLSKNSSWDSSTLNFTHNAHWTFSNYSLIEKARCRDFFHMSLGWFDWTSSSLQGKQGGSLRIKHIEPHRTFSTYTFTKIVKYRDFFLWLHIPFVIHPELMRKKSIHLAISAGSLRFAVLWTSPNRCTLHTFYI